MSTIDTTTGTLPAAVSADIAGADLFGISDVGAATIGGKQLDANVENTAASQLDDKYERPKRTPSQFNIAIIVAAALVFIVVIAWFESIRVWLEYAFNSSTKLLFNKAIGDLVYAAVATVIAICLIFLLTKFWIK